MVDLKLTTRFLMRLVRFSLMQMLPLFGLLESDCNRDLWCGASFFFILLTLILNFFLELHLTMIGASGLREIRWHASMSSSLDGRQFLVQCWEPLFPNFLYHRLEYHQLQRIKEDVRMDREIVIKSWDLGDIDTSPCWKLPHPLFLDGGSHARSP